MPGRADAHIHLFEGSFQGSFTHRPGVRIDEAVCYQSLAKDHDVRAALVVASSSQPCCDFLAGKAAEHDWVRSARHPSTQTEAFWLDFIQSAKGTYVKSGLGTLPLVTPRDYASRRLYRGIGRRVPGIHRRSSVSTCEDPSGGCPWN